MVWPNRGSNPRSCKIEASMLTITPPMRLWYRFEGLYLPKVIRLMTINSLLAECKKIWSHFSYFYKSYLSLLHGGILIFPIRNLCVNMHFNGKKEFLCKQNKILVMAQNYMYLYLKFREFGVENIKLLKHYVQTTNAKGT